MFGDGGDRFRTSHVRFNLFPFRIGNKMVTGDPGPDGKSDIRNLGGDKNGTYVKGPYGDPDRQRNGILYFGLGPIEMGWDSEGIRNRIQNKWIHDLSLINSPYFKDLRGTDLYNGSRFYFQFGWGGMW